MVEALPAVHTVPAVGYAVRGQDRKEWWVFSGDTERNPAFWERVNALPVAMLVMAIGMSLGAMNGYANNPARDFGPRFFALVAGAYGLVAAGLPVWAGFLIVAGVLLLLAIVLGLVGRARAKRVGPPQRALEQVQQTKLALAGRGDAATTSTP